MMGYGVGFLPSFLPFSECTEEFGFFSFPCVNTENIFFSLDIFVQFGLNENVRIQSTVFRTVEFTLHQKNISCFIDFDFRKLTCLIRLLKRALE